MSSIPSQYQTEGYQTVFGDTEARAGSNNLTITNQGNSVDLMLDESGNWWVF